MSNHLALYKYTDSKYFEGFLNDGNLRIGTLFDYRRMELGTAIGDAAEGKKTLYAHNPDGLLIIDSDAGNHSADDYAESLSLPIDNFAGSNAIPIPDFMQDGIIREGENPGRFQWIVDGGGPVSREYEDNDCYIFSCSNTFDRNAMLEFGYDACIVIHDISEFFNRISKKLKKIGSFYSVESCIYTDRQIVHDSENAELRPSLIKEREYGYQKEVRAIWSACHSTIKPRILEVGSLTDICSVKANPLVGGQETTFAEKEFADLIFEYFGVKESDASFANRASIDTTYHSVEGYRSLDLLWDGELVLSSRYHHDVYNGRVLAGQSLTKNSGWLTKHHRRKTENLATQV